MSDRVWVVNASQNLKWTAVEHAGEHIHIRFRSYEQLSIAATNQFLQDKYPDDYGTARRAQRPVAAAPEECQVCFRGATLGATRTHASLCLPHIRGLAELSFVRAMLSVYCNLMTPPRWCCVQQLMNNLRLSCIAGGEMVLRLTRTLAWRDVGI